MSNAAGIFISYRRQEASYLAGWLHDRLADHFGQVRVFLDIDSIRPGLDFTRVIVEAITRSAVLLVLIGPQWLTAERNGHRRLQEPDDSVRMEIETAFQRDIRVIPLLLEGTPMPRAEDLPDSVARLSRLNALRVDYDSFRTDVARLVNVLDAELTNGGSSGLELAEVGIASKAQPGKAARAAPVDLRRDEDQRARLLTRLARTYTGFLEQSVEHHSMLHLQLDLDWIPEKTFRPQDQLLAVPQTRAERLPAGTSLLQAFDKAGGLDGDGLLILGDPGAGKTTLLFELARCLVQRAQSDPRHPVPVYLPLSSWATRRPRLDQWLVEQLAELYQIPRSLGRRWTHDAQLLFLLDGLDEIPDRNDRAACVKAINRFNRFGRSYRLPMIVASRPVEYDILPVKLQLETGIGVCPLDPTAVLDRLRQAGSSMRAAVAVLERDPQLQELLRSLLLVSMLTLTYADVPEAQIHAASGTPAERRDQLISDYVNRRFELDRRGAGSNRRPANAYPPERTRAWLSALARNLTRSQQTVVLLGRLPPDWLPTRWARWAVMAAPGLIFALFLGSGSGLLAGRNRLVAGLGVGLIAGLGAGLGAGLIGQPQARRLSWSWTQARLNLRTALIARLSVVLLVGLVVGLLAGPRFGLGWGLGVGLSIVLVAGLSSRLGVGFTVGLVVGLVSALIMGLNFGVTSGFRQGLIAGLTRGLEAALAYGLLVGVIAGLGAGLVRQPQPTERLSWSWTQARSKLRTAPLAGLSVVLGLKLITGLGAKMGTSTSIRLDLHVWLILGLAVALTVGLLGGLSKSMIPVYITPNEGIRRSIRNGLVTALIVAAAHRQILALDTSNLLKGWLSVSAEQLITSLMIGLSVGLIFGLGAVAQHGILRLLLWRYSIAPIGYVRWLNYTVHLRLLYRGVSGGYVFIHRVIQDYFADSI